MSHRLPQLPYDYTALEPYIDARTMELHHGKHHASYVQKLNTALESLPYLREKPASTLLLELARVPEKLRSAVRNNAGGHVNHSIYWRAMSPTGGGAPKGPLADAIDRDFGSFEKFKTRFVAAGAEFFGSGWVWLASARDDDGKLVVVTTAGHDNPLMQGRFPILVNDLWEHAYYLKHQNRRPEFLEQWWAVVNWDEASRRFERLDQSAEQKWEEEGGRVSPPRPQPRAA